MRCKALRCAAVQPIFAGRKPACAICCVCVCCRRALDLRDAPKSVLKRFTSPPDLSALGVSLVACNCSVCICSQLSWSALMIFLNIVERACKDR